jgi:PAS domain S-box-containing protein
MSAVGVVMEDQDNMSNPDEPFHPSTNQADSINLRKQAEEKAAAFDRSISPAFTPEEMQRTLHELRVHQIELEMQNEELGRVQQELDASRERYFDLYDLAPVGYITLSDKGLILEANLTAAGLLGVCRSALAKQPLSHFILKEDQDIYYRHREQLFESGEPQNYDLRMVKEGGIPFWAHLVATVSQNGEGIPLCRAVISDITGRKKAEESLRESKEIVIRSEARLKKAQTVARIGDWSWNIQEGRVEWSDEMYHIFGIDKSSYTGRLGDVITQVIHPDDLHLVLPSNAAKFAEKKPVEYRIIRPDGSIRHIRAESGDAILDEAGNPIFLTGVAQDITERVNAEIVLKKNEGLFRTLASLAPVGIYLTNADKTCLYTNPTWQKMAGLSAEEALGHGWVNGIHPEDRELVFLNWQKMVESQGKWGLEYRFQNREGKSTIVFGIASTQKDASGNIVGYIGVNIDITERKQAEEEIRKANERLHLAQEASNSGTWDWDITKDTFFWSDEFFKLFGVDQHTIPGFEAWNKSLHPDDIEMASKKIREAIDQKTELMNDYRIILPNKEVRWIRAIGNTFYEGDRPTRMLGLCLDITELKQAEIFSKNLVTMNPVSIQVLDTQGFTLEVNPAFKKLFGSVPPADYSLFNDPQLAQQGIQVIFDQLRNGEVVHFPDVSFNPRESIPSLPDAPNWVRTIGFPIFSENEKPERFVLMQENITEKKNAEVTLRESEFKFRQTFDVSPVGIVMVGLDTRFIQCNHAFAQSLGYETQELVGRWIDDVTLPEDSQIGKAEMAAIMKGEIRKAQVQKRYLRKDGQFIWGEVTISLIRDSNEQALYFLAIIQNITERKQAEEQIRKLNNELEQRVKERTAQLEFLNNELQAFSYSVSHDLRAPLRALDGFSAILKTDYQDKLDPQAQSYLNRIQEASHRMGQLIDDLLNLSRITRREIKLDRVDLSQLARQIADELISQFPERQAEFEISPDLIVRADHGLIKIALENLLHNAFKYSSKKAMALIQVGVLDQPGPVGRIYFVRDNGVGFDMAYADKLFTPFQRLHGPQEFPGTGIGLTIVQRIISRHGGRIWGEAAVNQGATFYFTLSPR